MDRDRLLVGVDEAARLLSVGRSHMYVLLARGELRSLTIGRCRRIAVSELERFISQRFEAEAVDDFGPNRGNEA